ncbi:Modification methylase VspI [termite gut metagenome]|uniref:site-specific DNA-methyltransferase (adenine-specific) n=1 Tax=termite gut metagenome TaxID=433724 RepID=A0A5J4SZG2_9ZZZZ
MTTTEFSRAISEYEGTLALSKRKADGIFYTDLSLAEKIINELSIPKDAVVLDPCCGIGCFNYAAIKCGITTVYGADIDNNAINLCVRNIPYATFVRANSIEMDSKFFLSKLSLSDRVDYIIGNPPYAKWIPSKWASRAFSRKVVISGNNLFIAGLIKAIELVKQGGFISYIIPKNFLHVAAYSHLRREILREKTIVSIIDIGAYFKNVRGEQIVFTIKNSIPENNKFAIKKLIKGVFVFQMKIDQTFFDDEILLYNNEMDYLIYQKLNAFHKLKDVCNGYIGRGRSSNLNAVAGKGIRKFGYKNISTPSVGNQIFIQNIYSVESGIIAAFGGDLEASQTVTILTDGDEKMCRFILGILHSQLCNFFLYKYCYNYSKLTMHTDSNYLKKIPLPEINADLITKIVDIVTFLEKEEYMSAAWFKHIKNLNTIVYEVYKLSDDERTHADKEMKFIQSKKWSENGFF